MKILADSNVESLIVGWLRATEHDVVWAAELPPRLSDTYLLELARQEERMLLTHDLDFGELVFRRRLASHSVVLMRLPPPEQQNRLELLQGFWPELAKLLSGKVFAVLTESEIRVRPLSEPTKNQIP